MAFLALRSWKQQRGFQRVSQLWGQRKHYPSSVLRCSITSYPVSLTVPFGNCVPEGPRLFSVLPWVFFPRASSVSWPLHAFPFLFPSLHLLPQLLPFFPPVYTLSHSARSHGVLAAFQHLLPLRIQRETRPDLGDYCLPFRDENEYNSCSETICTLSTLSSYLALMACITMGYLLYLSGSASSSVRKRITTAVPNPCHRWVVRIKWGNIQGAQPEFGSYWMRRKCSECQALLLNCIYMAEATGVEYCVNSDFFLSLFPFLWF